MRAGKKKKAKKAKKKSGCVARKKQAARGVPNAVARRMSTRNIALRDLSTHALHVPCTVGTSMHVRWIKGETDTPRAQRAATRTVRLPTKEDT